MSRPTITSLLPNLLAFALGLGAAWFLKWETGDLIWSLWLSSLLVGYLTILSTVGSGVILGLRALTHEAFPAKKRLPVMVGGIFTAAFLLAFFSVHFCAFHAVHATFLSGFFPIAGMTEEPFSDAIMNPVRLLGIAFTDLLPLYGVFLVAAVVVERDHLLAPWRNMPASPEPDASWDRYKAVLEQEKKKHKASSQHPMARPYVNVIRMHILIFFFAGVHLLHIDSFLTYAVVYAVYFFPWKEMGWFSKRKAKR